MQAWAWWISQMGLGPFGDGDAVVAAAVVAAAAVVVGVVVAVVVVAAAAAAIIVEGESALRSPKCNSFEQRERQEKQQKPSVRCCFCTLSWLSQRWWTTVQVAMVVVEAVEEVVVVAVVVVVVVPPQAMVGRIDSATTPSSTPRKHAKTTGEQCAQARHNYR